MADNAELSSVVGHLYVRLRRDCGRVIDAIWAARNADYALEILKLARSVTTDPEMERLATRYEQLMFGTKRSLAPPAAASHSAASDEPEADTTPVPGRYRGSLR